LVIPPEALVYVEGGDNSPIVKKLSEATRQRREERKKRREE